MSGRPQLLALRSSYPFLPPAITKNELLKIGVLAPRSGTAGTIGECGLRGALWAAERVNKAGGIAGRKVQLVIAEETTPKDTITNYQRLQAENVACVAQGIVSTGTSLAVAPIAENAKSLLILGWDDPEWRKRYDAGRPLRIQKHR